MQRSLPTKLTAMVLSVGLSPAYCWTLFINFMKQLNRLLPLQRSNTQHTFVGFNDGVPVAYPVLSFDFLIRRWMWIFMNYICAHLTYINSGQIFRLNVKDVKRHRELDCTCCGGAVSHGGSILWAQSSWRHCWAACCGGHASPQTEFSMSVPQISSKLVWV